MPASFYSESSPDFELSKEARSQLVKLVWQVLDEAMQGKRMQLPPEPDNQELLKPAACFVTLHHNGELRGCIGSLEVYEPLWLNACKNAYASGFKDTRFSPLTAEDRSGLSLEISVLSELIPVSNEGEIALLGTLRPYIDGLLLEEGAHRSVFLPSVWEMLPTPRKFVQALKRKGGWLESYWSEDITIHRFTTVVVGDT